MINIFRLVFLAVCGFSLSVTWVYASNDTEPDFPLSSEWGKPVFEQYTPPNTVREWMWRYTRKNATLIVTRSECEKCKPVTQQDVDEYNSQEAQMTGRNSALLLDFKGAPAMLRISTNRKNMNFRVFQIYANGFYYKIHMGINQLRGQSPLESQDRWGQTRLIFDNFQVSNSLLGNKEGQVLFLPFLLHKKMPLLAASEHDARKICAIKLGG